MKYEMTKQLEDLLDRTVKLNKAYKTDANPQLKNVLFELMDQICKELAIQQINLDR
jgi:hypothetical protein